MKQFVHGLRNNALHFVDYTKLYSYTARLIILIITCFFEFDEINQFITSNMRNFVWRSVYSTDTYLNCFIKVQQNPHDARGFQSGDY